jgi:dynactin 1
MEDRDVKKALEKAQQERDQYKGIIEKLQTKYRPQQQENADLKQALSESEQWIAKIESQHAEHDTIVEMATLDREMAEETAENLKVEVEALRAQNEEVQLELEILREENSELTKEMSPEERDSAGFVQLQHSNDRLRNALLALRDRSLDEKEELDQQIKSLEDQVKDHDNLRHEHEDTREKLLRSEANTEDLRQQLEVALEAEEMIEQLTERNSRLENVNTELRDAIEDLENLKELNDELEVNHVEAEKQMQEEIEFKDSLLTDREHMAQTLQDALDDRNQIINQFRSFVSSLQTEMSDMKASKEISESEAKQLEGKSRAMLDLNLKLQNSAAKTQVKTIDLELRKLDAQEASEHLAIVQLFLPEAFHSERDSVLALLRFKRIGFKATLVHSFVKERVASFGSRGADEDVFAACDVLDKLTWISAMAERFVNSICACSVEEFTAYESALYELEPVERALNGYVDGLRREEVKEREMAQELQRSIAVMSHLASLHIKDDLASHADDLLMRTQCLQSQLESAATALQLTRGMIETNLPKAGEDDESEDDEGSASDLAILLTRADTLVNHVRSAKVMAGKTHRALEDLQGRALTLEASHTEAFDNTEAVAEEVARYTRVAGDALQTLFGDEGRNEPFLPAEVASALSRTAMATFALQAPEAGPFTSLASRLRDLSDVVTDLASLPTDLDNTVEFERAPAPWVARANELKQTKITSIDTEAELARTLENLHNKEASVREKETELEEQSVRIEMLEARMKDASKRSAKIAELEQGLREAKDAERRAKKDLERVKEDMGREVERVREEMGKIGEERRKRGSGEMDVDGDVMGATAKLTMRRLEFKIESLEGAVRYLKEENLNLQMPPVDSPLSAQRGVEWLHQPLTRPKTDALRRKEGARKEGMDVLQQMLELAGLPQAVDLTKMPENKLAWRPVKESSRWRVERRKEEWEGWKGRLVRGV